MASRVFSVRLADDLAARVEEIASAQGVKSPSVLKAAVESYVGDHDRGLPGAPREVAPAKAVASLDVAAIRAKAAAAARGGS